MESITPDPKDISLSPTFREVTDLEKPEAVLQSSEYQPIIPGKTLFELNQFGPNITQIIADGANLAINNYLYKDMPLMSVEEQKREFGYDFGAPLNPIQARFKAKRKREEEESARAQSLYTGGPIKEFLMGMAGSVYYDPAGMLTGIGAGKVLGSVGAKLANSAFKAKYAASTLSKIISNPVGNVLAESALETSATAPLEYMRNKQIGTKYDAKNFAWMLGGNILGNSVSKGLHYGLGKAFGYTKEILKNGSDNAKADILSKMDEAAAKGVPIPEELIEKGIRDNLRPTTNDIVPDVNTVHERPHYGPTIGRDYGNGITVTSNKEVASRSMMYHDSKIFEVEVGKEVVPLKEAPLPEIANKLLSSIPQILKNEDIPDGLNSRALTQPLDQTIEEIVDAAENSGMSETRVRDTINKSLAEMGIKGYHYVDDNGVENLFIFDDSIIKQEKLTDIKKHEAMKEMSTTSKEIDDYIKNPKNDIHYDKEEVSGQYDNPIPSQEEIKYGISEELDHLLKNVEKVNEMDPEKFNAFAKEAAELEEIEKNNPLFDGEDNLEVKTNEKPFDFEESGESSLQEILNPKPVKPNPMFESRKFNDRLKIKEFESLEDRVAKLKQDLDNKLKELQKLKGDVSKESEGFKALFNCVTKG